MKPIFEDNIYLRVDETGTFLEIPFFRIFTIIKKSYNNFGFKIFDINIHNQQIPYSPYLAIPFIQLHSSQIIFKLKG